MEENENSKEDFEEFLNDMLKEIDTKRKAMVMANTLARHAINGLVVATGWCDKLNGYETVIIDKNDCYLVQKYIKRSEDPEAGHYLWCEKAKTIDTIMAWNNCDHIKPEQKLVTLTRGYVEDDYDYEQQKFIK